MLKLQELLHRPSLLHLLLLLLLQCLSLLLPLLGASLHYLMQRRKCTLKRLNLSCLFQDSSNLFKKLYSLSCNPQTSLSLSGIMMLKQVSKACCCYNLLPDRRNARLHLIAESSVTTNPFSELHYAYIYTSPH